MQLSWCGVVVDMRCSKVPCQYVCVHQPQEICLFGDKPILGRAENKLVTSQLLICDPLYPFSRKKTIEGMIELVSWECVCLCVVASLVGGRVTR